MVNERQIPAPRRSARSLSLTGLIRGSRWEPWHRMIRWCPKMELSCRSARPGTEKNRSRRIDIDIIGAADPPGHVPAAARNHVVHVAYVVNAPIVGIVSPYRDQPMTNDLRNCAARNARKLPIAGR